MMHGTIQTIHAARGFGFLRDPEGAEVLFHRRALTPPERFATLELTFRTSAAADPCIFHGHLFSTVVPSRVMFASYERR
jgi:hypothetical protein